MGYALPGAPRKFAYLVISIHDPEYGWKELTYDLPDGIPLPETGDLVEVVYGGLKVPVVGRTWSIRDRVEVRLQDIAIATDEGTAVESSNRTVWTLGMGDCSNELHSAGWES